MSIVVYAALAVVALTGIFLLARVLSRRGARGPDEPAAAAAAAPEADEEPVVTDLPPTPRPPESYEARLKGDVRLDGKTVFPGGAFIEGNLTLAKASAIEGEIEVRGDVTLGEAARLTHPVVVHGNLVLGPGAAVRASLVEGRVTLYRDAFVEGALECDSLHLSDTDVMPETPTPVPGTHTVPIQPIA